MEVERYVNILKRENLPIIKEDINFIIKAVEKTSYETIAYKFPTKDYLAVLLKYFEEREEYEKCKTVFDFIKVHNSLSEDKIKTKL